MASSKLTMIIEMADKMSSKLGKMQSNWGRTVDKMKEKYDNFISKLPERYHNAINKMKPPSFLSRGIGFGLLAGVGMQAVNMGANLISNLSTEAITAVDSVEKFKSTMSFAGFKNNAIETASKEVNKYAADTVYDLSTVANTTAQLAANGISDYVGLTKAVGNLNAVAGGNANTFSSVAMVMTQTAGAGKLTTENWNQLANAIPGASGKLQEAMLKSGAYTGNFREAMEKGMITADEFNSAIMQLGTEPIAVEAAKSTKTFEGALGQLKAGIVEGLGGILQEIGVDNITNAINGLASAFAGVLSFVASLINEFKNGNPLIGILVGLVLSLTTGLIAYNLYTGIAAIATNGFAAAQWILNAALNANPIGLIIMVIAALIAFVAMAINKYDEWGAAALALLGPFGLIINFIKSIYDHWESIKKAFQTDGIVGGLKRIGQVLLDAFLKPLQQGLEMLSNIPGVGNIAGNWAGKIEKLRGDMNLIQTNTKAKTTEQEAAKITPPKAAQALNLYGSSITSGDKNDKKGAKTNGKLKNDIDRVSGEAKQVRNITIHIDSLHKGDNVVNSGGGRGMSFEEFEQLYNDMMMRIIRNAETI